MTPAEPAQPAPEALLAVAADPIQPREKALGAALRIHEMVGGLHAQCGGDRAGNVAQAEDAVRATADKLAAWLEGPIAVFIDPGPVFDEETGLPTPTKMEDGIMQINTGQGFYVSVKGKDRSGYVTTIPDVEVSTDNSAVTTVSRDPQVQGRWKVGSGEPGESTLTVELPPLQDGGEPRTARLVVDVVPGDAEVLEFEIGEVFEEDTAPPAEPAPGE